MPEPLAQEQPKEEDVGDAACDPYARHLPVPGHVDDAAQGQCIHPHGASLAPGAGQKGSISERLPGDFGTQVGKAPQQKEIRTRDGVDSMHPTDQVVRQKEHRKVREAKFAEEGLSPEETKKVRRRKKLHQEDHKDDCGSEIGPLEEIVSGSTSVVDASFGPAIAYSYVNDNARCSDSAESS